MPAISLIPSKLLLTLTLELRRLARLVSFGSCGLSPLARANKFRISVRLTTPVRWPDRLAPGIADALIEGVESGDGIEWCGDHGAFPEGFPDEGFVSIGGGMLIAGLWLELALGGGERIAEDDGENAGCAGVTAGVGGPDEAGEGGVVIHILRNSQSVAMKGSFTQICSPVRFGGNQLRHGMGESGLRSNVEHREGVFPVNHTTL